MVIVYLKNGEKAPIPDANYVKLERVAENASAQALRCFVGDTEVGYFSWEEVAGYAVTTLRVPSLGSNDAWAARLDSQGI